MPIVTLCEELSREQGRATNNPTILPPWPQTSRRSFLKVLGTLAALLVVSPQHAFAAMRLNRVENGIQLRFGDELLWKVDTSWLSGSPVIRTSTTNALVRMSLRGARYPGVEWAADFDATISISKSRPTLVLRHSLSWERVEVDFFDWLTGKDALTFEVRQTSPIQVGEFLRVEQVRSVQFTFDPMLHLIGRGERAWSLSGKEAAGHSDSLQLTHLIGPPLVRGDEMEKRSVVVLGQVTVNPRPFRDGDREALVSRMDASTITIEATECGNIAYRADAAKPIVIHGLGPSIESKILGLQPRFARLVSADGSTESRLIADQGQSVMNLGHHVLTAGPAREGAELRIGASAGTCVYECDVIPRSLAIATEEQESVTITFKRNTGKGRLCGFGFCSNPILLDDAELSVMRPANAMWLRFKFDGFQLHRSWLGFGSLHLVAAPSCRLYVVMPPQAVLEQAYYQPPSQLPNATQDLAGPWVAKQAQFASPQQPGKVTDFIRKSHEGKHEPGSDEARDFKGPSAARISGESQLVFRLRDDIDPKEISSSHNPFSLDLLLGPSLWQPVVVQDAASCEDVRRKALIRWPSQKPQEKAEPPRDASYLEIPWGLYISPDERAQFLLRGHYAQSSAMYHDVFRLEMFPTPEGIPLRAIGARLFNPAELPSHFDPQNQQSPDAFRTALDYRDRHQLVWLTSQWSQRALLGTADVRQAKGDEGTCSSKSKGMEDVNFKGIYVPRPFHARHLLLTALGGSMDSLGRWDPPALCPLALSVERWQHRSSFGRSNLDIVCYKGFLLPFGNRCTLIKVTQRREKKHPDQGPVSLPIQKFFLQITDPLVKYGEFLAPYRGRTWPFRQIELTRRGQFEVLEPAATAICGKGRSAFKVCVSQNKPCDFEFIVDGDLRRKGTARMVFIDNDVAHDVDMLIKVRDAMNRTKKTDWTQPSACLMGEASSSEYSIDLFNSKVTYAPAQKPDDTAYVTGEMWVRVGVAKELVNTAVVEASRRPPTFAEMETANIVIPTVNKLTGKGGTVETEVRFAPLYRDVGFDVEGRAGSKNKSEVFLELIRPVLLNFSGKGDRSGAVATPNIQAENLSRSAGLMGPLEPVTANTTANTVAVMQKPEWKSSFSVANLFTPDAKLLGVIPITALLNELGLSDVPKFIESARQQLNTVESEIAKKACSFVEQVKRNLPSFKNELDREVARIGSSATKALQSHLEAFLRAVESIQCPPPSGDSILDAVTDAARALDETRKEVEALLQNPGVLLPDSALMVIQQWKQELDALRREYESCRNIIEGMLKEMQTAATEVRAELQEQVGAYLATAVDKAQAELIEALSCFTDQLTVYAFLDSTILLYAKYRELYADLAGALVEIRDAWKAAATEISNLGTSALFVVASNQLSNAVRDAIVAIDERLRNAQTWPTSAQEEARSFFRRIEPCLDDLTNAYKVLHNMQRDPKSFAELPGMVKSLHKAIGQIRTAADLAATAPNAPEQLRAWLVNVTGEAAKVRDSLSVALLQLRTTPVRLPDNTLKTFEAIVNDLRQAMSNSNMVVVPGIGDALKAAWASGIPDDVSRSKLIDASIQLFGVATVAYAVGQTKGIPPKFDTLDRRLKEFFSELTNRLCGWLIAAFGQAGDPKWLEELCKYDFLLTKDIVESLKDFARKGSDVAAILRTVLANPQMVLQQPAGLAYQNQVLEPLENAAEQWRALSEQVKRLVDAPDRFLLEKLQRELDALVSSFIPAQVDLNFDFSTEITKSTDVFLKECRGMKARLTLSAHIMEDLRGSTSKSNFKGALENFTLKFSFLIIGFTKISFQSASGSAPHLDQVGIDFVRLIGPLEWVKALADAFQAKTGPYMIPTLSGIRAGFRFEPGTFAIGPMIVQNLVIDAGIEIPFDDRAAVTTFALSSRQSPALLFIPPYGGACYLSLMVAGDRLISAEASFEAGIVSGFNLAGVVEGSGRITVGVFYRQEQSGVVLEGFFFAGGNAVVLGIASMSVALRIGLRYKGEGVNGYGEFSTTLGSWPVEWTLHYGVGYDVAKSVHGVREIPTSNILAKTSEASEQRLVSNFSHPGVNIFFDDALWQKFRSAFADV